MCTRTWSQPGLALATMGLLMLGLAGRAALGDEPGFFGRLFRGSNAQRSAQPDPRSPAANPSQDPYSSSLSAGGGAPSGLPPATPTNVGAPALIPGPSPAPRANLGPATRPSTMAAASSGPDSAAPIRPQPRISQAATEADPILTRITLGRGNDGSRFGMFLQIYSGGTVIDSEGVHRIGAEAMRPVLEALQAPELYHVHGHCGSPPTDSIEQVYVIVYERKFNGLRANTFSYSGNTAGCDHAVHRLQAAVDALQAKLSATATDGTPAAASPPTPTTPVPGGAPIGAVPPPPAPPSETLSLTPSP